MYCLAIKIIQNPTLCWQRLSCAMAGSIRRKHHSPNLSHFLLLRHATAVISPTLYINTYSPSYATLNTGHVRINVIMRRVFYHCCRGKAMNVTHSECVSVVLVIQHARPLRRNLLQSLACIYRIFSTWSHNGTIFGEKIERTMCGPIYCTKFVRNICHSKKSARYYQKCTLVVV
jgi:hypothetical protein